MTSLLAQQDSREAEGQRFGLPFPALFALALLAVPRVVLHDLDIVTEGDPLNALLVFLPPLIWIAVVLWRRVPAPFTTLLVVGLIYGILLLLVHQLLWDHTWGDDPPRFGDNLEDVLPAGVESLVIRTFAALSSLATGAAVGAITGGIAHLLSRLRSHTTP